MLGALLSQRETKNELEVMNVKMDGLEEKNKNGHGRFEGWLKIKNGRFDKVSYLLFSLSN